jgi:HK97 family phage major capsid protein
MSIRTILARRDEIRNEMRQIHDAAAGGTLSAEAQARWAALESEASGLAEQERRQAMLDELDRRAEGAGLAGSGDTRFDDLANSVSVLDTIRAQMGATDAGAGRARELSREYSKRSGVEPVGLYAPMGMERRNFTLSAGAGSNLVQTTVAASVIDVLRAKSIVMGLGAQTIGGLVGNLALPRLATSASVGWVLDNTAVPTGNPVIEQQVFTPHHVGGLVSLSRQLVQQSSPDVARVVQGDLATLIATAIDAAAIAGTGASGQPTGILNTAGLTIVPGGANGLAISYLNLQAMIGAVDIANALDGKLGFATNSKVAKSLRTTLKTTVDASSNFIVTTPGQCAGYPLAISQNIGSNYTKGSGTQLSAAIFGDWSSLYIASWSMLDVLVNPFSSTSYPSGGVDVRCMATVDIGTRHIAAFSAMNDIIAP